MLPTHSKNSCYISIGMHSTTKNIFIHPTLKRNAQVNSITEHSYILGTTYSYVTGSTSQCVSV